MESYIRVGSKLKLTLKTNTMTNKNNYFYELSDKGIGDHNTVSSGPDSGANAYMAKAFWNCMRHATTENAVNNWLSRIKSSIDMKTEIELFGAGNLNIGGHGNEGFLETGCGQSGNYDYKTNYVTTWNIYYHKPYLIKLKNKGFPIIYIYSCHTGAGEMGADFLFMLAQIIGKPVAGRTGFTYSNNQGKIWFENGSVWQVATPSQRPTPINAPTPHYTKNKILEFSDGKVFKIIELDKITEFQVERFFIGNHSQPINLIKDNEINQNLLMDFFSSEPFQIDGSLFALLTGKLTIKVISDEIIEVYHFDVYNDKIVADKYGNYYYCNHNIQLLMRTA